MSSVCFVAVSYFGSRDVEPYINSLVGQTDGRWVLRIIDNSQDDAENKRLCKLAANDRRIQVWTTGANLGYFGAAEWARHRLDVNKHAWIAVTNTDVVLDSSRFVEDLILLKDASAGVVAPAIYGSRSRTALNPYMRTRPTVARSRIRRAFFSNIVTAQLTVLASHWRRRAMKGVATSLAREDIYAAHGSFMIFGRSFFEAGGTFEHSSFLFGEELTVGEFCGTHNLRTTYVPHLVVEHTEHANTGVIRSRKVLKAQVTAAKNALELIAAKNR